MSEFANRKLRVGILLDSFHVPAWVAKTIDDIRNCPYATITLVVMNESTMNNPPSRQIHPTRDNHTYALWKLYCWFDNKTHKVVHDPFKPADIQLSLNDIKTITINPLRKKYSDYFSNEKINEILSYDLDVVFRFGFRILRGKSLKIAKFGVWGFHHGDSRFYRGGPPAFWELMNQELVIGSELQILTPRLNSGTVIYRSWSQVTWYSMIKTLANCYWKTTNFAVRKLRDLHELGESALKDVSNGVEYCAYSSPLYKLPTNRRLLYFCAFQISKIIRQTVSKIYYRFQWFLAFKISDSDHGYDVFYDYDYMVPPTDRTWADPFVIHHDNNYFVFVEEFPFNAVKGHISVFKVNQNGDWSDPVRIIDENYHLSYPFVFNWNNNWFMIPESVQNNSVDLYIAKDFPYKWEFHSTLLDSIRAVDATIHEHDGRLWMFANSGDHKTSLNEELHIFYADSPLGPWIPHARNPVKSDVRSTRPAGKLFYWHGDLYRPSQDCSLRYGYAITISRIKELSTDSFREVEVSKIVPNWKKHMIGNHMLNRDGKFTIIDAYRRLRRF